MTDPRPEDIEAIRALRFVDLIEANLSRVKRWHPSGVSDWSPLEWAGAMAGEAGEACNAAKKLKRIDGNLQNINEPGRSLTDRAIAAKQVAKEVADTIIYGVLVVAAVGEDLEAALVEVFNKKSEEYGFPERLTLSDSAALDQVRQQLAEATGQAPQDKGIEEQLHHVLTIHGIASRSDYQRLVTDLIRWAAESCRRTLKMMEIRNERAEAAEATLAAQSADLTQLRAELAAERATFDDRVAGMHASRDEMQQHWQEAEAVIAKQERQHAALRTALEALEQKWRKESKAWCECGARATVYDPAGILKTVCDMHREATPPFDPEDPFPSSCYMPLHDGPTAEDQCADDLVAILRETGACR